MYGRPLALLLFLIGATASRVRAQPAADTRTQYPPWLANSYFSVNLGSLQNAFSARQLEPGFEVASVDVPHVAARVAPFGHELTPWLAVQFTYMRPVHFVHYRDLNGDGASHSVWTGFGGATLRVRAPVARRVSFYGEGGLGVASRHGFNQGGVAAVRDGSYTAVMLGVGVEYRAAPSWHVTAGATFIPGNAGDRQAPALMIDGGFRYTMRPLPDARAAANRESGFVFPEHLLQVEYSTGVGYAINTFLSTRLPIFWKGTVKVDRGIAAHYQQNVFHTRKVLAFDLGGSVSTWRSRDGHDGFVTLSAYPLLRFFLVRSANADVYFCYSLAGPTFVSTRFAAGRDLGGRFTFQDFMGAGVVVGRARSIVLGIKINHYSNGNLFPENAGVMVPVTLTLGWGF